MPEEIGPPRDRVNPVTPVSKTELDPSKKHADEALKTGGPGQASSAPYYSLQNVTAPEAQKLLDLPLMQMEHPSVSMQILVTALTKRSKNETILIEEDTELKSARASVNELRNRAEYESADRWQMTEDFHTTALSLPSVKAMLKK